MLISPPVKGLHLTVWGRMFLIIALAFAFAGCDQSSKAARPTASGLIPVETNDPEMLAAMKNARDHFPEFWQVLVEDRKREVPLYGDALVKAYFSDPDKPEAGEHMWVAEIQYDGKSLSGTLVDTPEHVRSVEPNQKVSLPVERISDWLYVQDGKAVGAFTVKLLRSRMSSKDREAHDIHYPFRFE